MPQSEKDVVNVVQIQCEGYNNKKETVPVVAMKGQVDLLQYVDILVPCPAKIKLLSGEGPIFLSGSHCVDYCGNRDHGEDEELEEENVEMEEDGDKKEDLRNKLKKEEKEEVAEENRSKKKK